MEALLSRAGRLLGQSPRSNQKYLLRAIVGAKLDKACLQTRSETRTVGNVSTPSRLLTLTFPKSRLTSAKAAEARGMEDVK